MSTRFLNGSSRQSTTIIIVLDGTIWSILLSDTVSHPVTPKRLVDQTPLLMNQSPLLNDLSLRIRLVQSTQELEIVRMALDGLSVVQVLEVAKQGFGLPLHIAQQVHEAVAVSLEGDSESNVPTYLEPTTTRRKCQQLCFVNVVLKDSV